MSHKHSRSSPPTPLSPEPSGTDIENERALVKAMKGPTISHARKVPDATGHPKLCVVMVGLPARGKSYIAQKLAFYLNWVQVDTQVFNLGAYRRKLLQDSSSAQFFHPNNQEARQKRRLIALRALEDMFEWHAQGGMVGILDATNSTRKRRQLIVDRCRERDTEVFFVESVCEDDDRIQETIKSVKIGLPEYQYMNEPQAIADFKARIEYYRQLYSPLCQKVDGLKSFIKIVNVGSSFLVNRLEGYLASRIVRFLMNVHIKQRTIYLSRHGESEYNQLQRIGGDSDLSERGQQYATRLHEYMSSQKVTDMKVWCSTLKRTLSTTATFSNVKSWKALDELDAGECDGKTYEEIKEENPTLASQRDLDKYYFRYPRGESYHDVVLRLEPLLFEIERTGDVLIVCHQAVCRCLLAYFQRIDNIEQKLPYLEVPLHTVLKITPDSYGCKIESVKLGPESVSTHRPRATPTPPPSNEEKEQ
eukprot:m.50051 g.50051  ORF g.50051 m.50051 type:complete len:476 (-) comp17984_c0_seq3:43-1470(-)